MAGEFYRNETAANAADANRATEATDSRATLQDVHESLEGIRAIGLAMLRILAEWADTDCEELEP